LDLLVLGVLATDHSNDSVAPDDLAVLAHLLYGSSDFHSLFKLMLWLLEALHDPPSSGVVGCNLDLDSVPGEESQMAAADAPRPVGQDFVPIFERNPK
jgi:hypothetical protein